MGALERPDAVLGREALFLDLAQSRDLVREQPLLLPERGDLLRIAALLLAELARALAEHRLLRRHRREPRLELRPLQAAAPARRAAWSSADKRRELGGRREIRAARRAPPSAGARCASMVRYSLV